MNPRNWFQSYMASQTITRSRRQAPKPRARWRLAVEMLEDRCVPTAVAAPSGLVGWWTANNTGADVMGLNNATLFNGATYATGEVGQAFNFDGVNDRISVADSASLKLTTSLTIGGWIKVNAFPASGSGEIFFRGDDTRSPYSLSIRSDISQLNFSINGLTDNGSNLTTHLVLGQLTHVAATLDDATGLMSIYVNGALAAQTTTETRPYGDLQAASHPGVGIGNTGGYPGTTTNSPFNGLIDELAVYNRALTPGELLGIFKAGSDGKVLSPIAVSNPSVIEGSVGTTTPMTFTIQRTGSLSGPLTVAYATADDTAAAGSDYIPASGSVTFVDGEATKTLPLTVNGDNTGEANETFRLIVTPTGGTAIMGVATILNDDSAISISNASATEGDTAIRYLDDFLPVQSQLGGGRQCEFGPDGNFYVAGRYTNDVQKYDGKTGAYLGEVVPSGSFGLHCAWGLKFGPDGNLYVSGVMSQNVVRYNMTTGAIDEFVSSSSGSFVTVGLYSYKGMAFDALGNLYVCTTGDNPGVLRFQGPNGASPGSPLPAPGQTGALFVPPGSQGLTGIGTLGFGPDGNLYLCGGGTNSVLRYNGTTGAYIDAFVAAGSGGLVGGGYLAFRPDGFLYVAGYNSSGNGAVYRYNATTGAFNSIVAQSTYSTSGGMAWDAIGNLFVGYGTGANMETRFARYGAASQEAFTVTLDHASALPITISYSTAEGNATAGGDYTAVTSGSVYFAPGETSKTILIQTVDDSTIEPTETFTVNLSSPVGATSGTGVGTILDNDSTKFYVANDASTDRTYEYGAAGNSVENYPLNSGDSAPRGLATTAAGTTVWVADANKTVYVYNTSGVLLGSWLTGGLASNAQVEGIATNGTDVWLVDAKQDKVFKYTGAASRLSGSQNAASSFTLNSGNSSPKGIVTDGTSLWVVNDSSTDKVFKYNLSGTLLGSWTIDAANSSPTGLTINPANVSDIWTVDSGSKKVYQYTGAASRTSGSQNAAAIFALAAGNANPQDIADPPPGMMISQAAVLYAHPPSQPVRAEARVSGNRFQLDGAPWGWLISRAPGSDSEWLWPGKQGDTNNIDVLTAEDRELGSAIGFEHTHSMGRSLAAGMHRIPYSGSDLFDVAVLDQIFRDGGDSRNE
jgi:sugar lactone lactonase YvrE